MAHKLADETLQAILLHVLAVAEEDFADTSALSPFSRPDASGTNGALLLVCKRWMRVATPLFYHCVVLRTLPCAQALARTLKSNPALGPLIKQLRVEGGLGARVGKVMAAATNLQDLCILPDFRGRKTNVMAMCSALPHIQPRRLILCRMIKGTKSLERLSDALCSAFSTWTRLDKVVISAHTLPNIVPAIGMGIHEGGVKVHIIGYVQFHGYRPVSRLLGFENVSVVYFKSKEAYFSWESRILPGYFGLDGPSEVLERHPNRIKFTDDIPKCAA